MAKVDIPDDDFRLCYVRNNAAFFTNKFDGQTGDDWDDAPYEHNADEPYGDYHNTIKIVYFSGEFSPPRRGHTNSPYSVDMINAGAAPWLSSDWHKKYLYAGATFKEFQDFIYACDGEVYLRQIWPEK